MEKVRVAVVGTGYLGRQHVRVLSKQPNVELVGIVDKNPTTAQIVAKEFSTIAYPNHEVLFGKVSAVVLAVPTQDHAAIGCDFLNHGTDLLVEKPIASSLPEAECLIQTACQHGRILQVGHLERFNPAVIEARKILTAPLFFEVHRLGVFSPRSLDVDVVLDLMIHDLDLVLNFSKSSVKQLHAVGLPILSNKVDIANARIEFLSGCVANLTASRVSTEKVRKLRFFQPNQYVSLDFSRQDVVILSVEKNGNEVQPGIIPLKIETPRLEPLKLEIQSFLKCVQTRKQPEVNPESSKAALELALQVVSKIQEHNQSVVVPLKNV